jgi:hypothetical protein
MSDRLRWIYLEDHQTGIAAGMRCWFDDYRADIMPDADGYIYLVAECFNSGHDVYWTHPRHETNIFISMKKAEELIRQIAKTGLWGERENENGLEER